MILSDKTIRKLCMDKNPLIQPFEEEKLLSAGYQANLGSYVYRVDDRYFFYAEEILNSETPDISNDFEKYSEKIPIDGTGYIFKKKEFLVVDLKTKINLPKNITCTIELNPLMLCGVQILKNQKVSRWKERPTTKACLYNTTPYLWLLHKGDKIGSLVFTSTD